MTRPRLPHRDPLRRGAIVTLADGSQWVRCWHHPAVAWAQIVGTATHAWMQEQTVMHIGRIT